MAAPVRDHCLAPARVVDAPVHSGRYGRMFPHLPALEAEEDLLVALGAAGGPCDGGPTLDPDGGDDAQTVAAGWPVFGQFVAHDITADRSPLALHADPAALRNFRVPRANLELLYGAGPVGAPFLFARDDPARLLTGGHDLPRNAEGLALTGDPRQDVHTLMAQLHLAFIRAHNGLVDRLREDGVGDGEVHDEARRALTWHYQWVVLHDFLPGLVGVERARSLRQRGPRHLRHDAQPAIPLEFADAAYRYGHSQIRRTYRLNAGLDPVPLFPDLVGFRPVAPEREVDWALLFDLAGSEPAQRAKTIDERLPASLIQLPAAITGDVEVEAYHSLAVRDLQRGQATGLPSGEAVAEALGAEPLDAAEVGLADHGWRGETPLWFYVLREAAAREEGERLGPVGATIVGDVLMAIIDADPDAYPSVDPHWRPSLPAPSGSFGLGDLLAFASGTA